MVLSGRGVWRCSGLFGFVQVCSGLIGAMLRRGRLWFGRVQVPACAGMTGRGRGNGGKGCGNDGRGRGNDGSGDRRCWKSGWRRRGTPTPHLTSPLEGGRDELGRRAGVGVGGSGSLDGVLVIWAALFGILFFGVSGGDSRGGPIWSGRLAVFGFVRICSGLFGVDRGDAAAWAAAVWARGWSVFGEVGIARTFVLLYDGSTVEGKWGLGRERAES